MSRYCLDTVAYSHFRRGHAALTELVDTAEWIGMPVIVLGELFAGFEAGSRSQQNVAALEEFLAAPVVEVLPADRQTAEFFGKILADLRRRGRPIPVNDIWIAATCARAGATLLTCDPHFREVTLVSSLILE